MKIKLGQKVRHPELGVGEVVNIRNRDSQRPYSVLFRINDGHWETRFLTYAECLWKPRPQKKPKLFKTRPPRRGEIQPVDPDLLRLAKKARGR